MRLVNQPLEARLPLRKEWQPVFYDHDFVRLRYDEVENHGGTGELVVTDKGGNVLHDAEVTLRGSVFTVTAPFDRTLVLPLGKYEVTQGQWKRIMSGNPAKFQKGDSYPVERVSWNDVQEFLAELNKKSGRNFFLSRRHGINRLGVST